jgi:type IV secretory pathway TraG/TraD family ATPase VirD4
MPSTKRLIVAIGLGLYLYFLLPATATVFYELYHLVEIDAIYWGYSIFKAAGYYFGVWAYQAYACIAVALLILVMPLIFRKKNSQANAGEGA